MPNTKLDTPGAQLLVELTGAGDSSVPALLRGRAAATPQARFLRWQGEWSSYLDALTAAERFAGFLKQLGVAGADQRVATYLPNCPEALWTWFGTQLAGAVYVPLNRSHKGSLLADLLKRSHSAVLVTECSAVGELPDLTETDVEHVVFVDDLPAVPTKRSVASWADTVSATPWSGTLPQPQAIGAVMYTSGSTGGSKAVLMPHNQHARGAAHFAAAMELRTDDVWHAWPPHFHMMAQLYVIVASIVAGGGVALQPGFSRSQFWRQVTEGGCTVIGGMASVMRRLWTLPDDSDSQANPARYAFIAGAFGDLHHAFEARYGVKIADCFGMTEAEPITLPCLEGAAPGRHGRANGDFDVAIVDEQDAEVATGAVGEIVCRPRRPGVMFYGYEGDDSRTVEAWRNLWFHTGDLGRIDEHGYLHFLDRRKHGIRRLGENVSPWELEALLQRHEDVVEAVAVPVRRLDGDDDIKIVVVPVPDAVLTPERLHAWCKAEMAKFMVPRFIAIVDILPTLALGKVDRRALAQADGAWDAESAEQRSLVP